MNPPVTNSRLGGVLAASFRLPLQVYRRQSEMKWVDLANGIYHLKALNERHGARPVFRAVQALDNVSVPCPAQPLEWFKEPPNPQYGILVMTDETMIELPEGAPALSVDEWRGLIEDYAAGCAVALKLPNIVIHYYLTESRTIISVEERRATAA